jgi:hypothetical protein
MRKINYRPGLVILLTISVLFFCIQASVAQPGNVSKEGSIKPITQSISQPQMGKLLYSDDLAFRKISDFPASSNANITKYFKNNRYHISVIRKSYPEWTLAGKNFTDFVLNVNATQEIGPEDSDYGVVTRWKDGGNYSLFLISGDGFYSYAKRENNAWVVPVHWARSSAINTGNATNNIEVVSHGENLTFYDNGAKLGDYVDSKPVSGDLGLWVETFMEGNLTIGFDSLKVWEFMG